MTHNEQIEIFEVTFSQLKDTLNKKGADYANEDKLSNFKLAGNIAGITPEINCLSLIATKVARLGVLLNNPQHNPSNESIDDSIMDLANYTILLRMILIEKRENFGLRSA